MSRKKRKKAPVKTIINPMNYKRLFAFLRSLMQVPDRNFEPGLGLLLKGLYFEDGGDWFEAGKVCEKAAFLTCGFAYGHYQDRVTGKVVFKIFTSGELIINADSFFNGVSSGFSATLCPGANLMYITKADLYDLFKGYSNVQELAIKAVSALNRDMQERDRMLRLTGKKRIVRFFSIYQGLLKSARQGVMMYMDIASYLHMSPFNFSALLKELYPKLNDGK